MIKKFFAVMAAVATLTACGASTDNNDKTQEPQKMTTPEARPDSMVEITTTEGTIVVRLFGDTPRHQANFLKLVREGQYNGTLFHRVIDQFMIQAGDPDSRDAKPGQMLGSGDVGYTIPAEIVYPKHFHHRGALAAARQGDQVNPERASSGCQFYIVTGAPVDDATLSYMQNNLINQQMQDEFNRLVNQNMAQIQQMQAANDRQGLMDLQDKLVQEVEAKFKDAQAPELPADLKAKYKEVGGAPHLDGQYTVFGEVVSGMDVVEKIEKAQTDRSDRPVNDIRIVSMKVLE